MWFVPTASLSSQTLAFGMPSGYEWIIVAVLALLIFGKRLPAAARGVGEAFREFKRGLSQGSADTTAEQTAIAPRENAG